MFSLSLDSQSVGNIGCNHSELSINIQLMNRIKAQAGVFFSIFYLSSNVKTGALRARFYEKVYL